MRERGNGGGGEEGCPAIKKIKSLLLNVLGNEDNYLNVNFLIEYFVKLT